MSDQTTNKQESSNNEATNHAAEVQKPTEDAAKDGKEQPKKKKGFFEKWRESTAKAYDKHRAAGGNF